MTSLTVRRCALLLSVAASACVFGPRATSYAPANGPNGVTATLRFGHRQSFTAELLEVRDSGLVVLREDMVAFVPFRSMSYATFAETRASIWDGAVPDTTARRELRLVSRFPQGLTPDVERALL